MSSLKHRRQTSVGFRSRFAVMLTIRTRQAMCVIGHRFRAFVTKTDPSTPGASRPCCEHDVKLELPLYCCGSGCHDCVWLRYIEQLRHEYNENPAGALAEINKVADPVIQGFLLMEMKLNSLNTK